MIIPDHSISVVLQGPVIGTPHVPAEQQLTRRCAASIRRIFPAAEIVLSTWRGADVTGIEHDVLVESDDPGTVRTLAEKSVNLNRLLVSSRAGIERATRPYVLKSRTDIELLGDGFLRHPPRYPARAETGRIFSERLITWSWLTKVPQRSTVGLYHLSDMLTFGPREDVLSLWSVPLYTRSEAELADDRRRSQDPADTEVPLASYTSEQYLWLTRARASRAIRLPKQPDAEAIETAEQLLANNFIVLDPQQFQAQWKGGERLTRAAWVETYSYAEWQGLYRRHCDPSFRPDCDWQLLSKRLIRLALRRGSWLVRAYRGLYHWIVPDGRGKAPQPLVRALRARIAALFTRQPRRKP